MISEIIQWIFSYPLISIIPSIIVIIVSTIIYQVNTKMVKELRKFKGPPQNLFLGNAHTFFGPPEYIVGIFARWCKIYPPRYCYRIGFWNWGICIFDAKDVEKLLTSSVEIEKSHDYKRLFRWLGTGLLTSTGAKWVQRRKMLTPAFHFKILDYFVPIFNEQSFKFVNILRDEHAEAEHVFDIYPYITRCTLDIICETAMGKKIGAQTNRESEYLHATIRISQLFQVRSTYPIFHPDFIWYNCPWGWEEKRCLKVLHGFTNKVIKERKNDADNTSEQGNNTSDESVIGKKRLAFLDLLLEAQKNPSNNLTDEGIREETDTFMFEGHDTTAANLGYVIFLLGCYPSVQAKVHDELDEIFGEDKERPITTADLHQMKYLECCIKETLRLYPSVPFFLRGINNDFKLDEENTIPKGGVAFIFAFQLHRDPKHFPNPEAFEPERFLPENSATRNPFAYIPFSGGPRNCIGQKFAMMEEKIVLANFFRHFSVQSAETRDDLKLLPELILRTKNGIQVEINNR